MSITKWKDGLENDLYGKFMLKGQLLAPNAYAELCHG